MLAVRGVLLALLSASAQVGVECFHAHEGAAQRPQQQLGSSLPAPVPPSHAALLSASSDTAKLSRLAERMCGLRGDELSVWSMCEAAGSVKSASARSCQCVPQSTFSGLCAVRWLLRSRLVDRPASASFLCRRLLTERAVVVVSSGNPAASPISFYSSPYTNYAFGSEYSLYQCASEADIDRLSLHTQQHADVIAALCRHYNHREDKRRQSDKQAQPLPVPSSLDVDSASATHVSSHRSCEVRVGVFLASELVRWLKRTRAALSTRDAVLWGNYLIQHHIIRACHPPYLSQPQHLASGIGSDLAHPGPFRYAAVWYELQPAEHHLSHSCDRHPSPVGTALGTAQAALDSVSSLTPPLHHRQLSQAASAALSATASATRYNSLPTLPSDASLVLPLVEQRTIDDVAGAARAAAHTTAAVGETWLPLSLLCAPLLAEGRPTERVAGLLTGWEFVQSFGDEVSSYDFADADDLVTAVEFHPSGEYLAIGDKAGRVSIVEDALRAGGAGAGGGRQRGGQHGSEERGTEKSATDGWEDASEMDSPLEFRFFTEVQSHAPEFDCLKSCDISPRISALEWWPFCSSHLTLLAANERSVKVWRVESKQSQQDRQERQWRKASPRMRAVQRSEEDDTGIPSLWYRGPSASDLSSDEFPPVSSRCCSVFRGGHQYSIHSVSSCADGATFLSADDLRVLLFDLEHSDTACSVVELPAALTSTAAVEELLTVARFHPQHSNLFLHGSSTGMVRIADTRLRLNWDGQSVHSFTAAHSSLPACVPSSSASSALSTLLPLSSYLRSVTDSVLDARWGAKSSALSVFTRDFLFCRSWDLRRLSQPLSVSAVHPSLLRDVEALLDSEALFDSFELCVSPSGRQLVSGSYDNCFALIDHHSASSALIQARDDAREPLVLQHHTAEQLPAAVQRLAAPQQLSTHALPASFARCYTPTVRSVFVEATEQPLSSVGQQHKILKVAWHPHMEAVAVAGLYKLYLYQNRQPIQHAGIT